MSSIHLLLSLALFGDLISPIVSIVNTFVPTHICPIPKPISGNFQGSSFHLPFLWCPVKTENIGAGEIGSVVSSSYSLRGPEFPSHHPQWAPHNYLTLAPEELMPSSGQHDSCMPWSMCVHARVCVRTYA